MPSAYFFLPATYDFQQATLVQGALDSGLQVVASTASNYCTNARPVSDWADLQAFDYVFYCERTIGDVLHLTGNATHPALIFVDGADAADIIPPPPSLASYHFKRELPLRLAARCPGIKGLGFGMENRYVQKFQPFLQRQYLLSCMLRLDTNGFRRVLQGAVDLLKTAHDSRIFNGSTGEISYTGVSAVPQATPNYSRILSNSCLSVSCHGVGEDTGRFWEILGAGCLLFSQRLNIAIPDLPEDGKHCIYFTDEQDFLSKATYYMDHLDEAERIARAGHAFAQKKCSSRARFEYVVNVLNKPLQPMTLQQRFLIGIHNLRLRCRRRLSRLSEVVRR